MNTIEQIELQKFVEVNTTAGQAFNNGIDTALEILRLQTVIECKALRKRGVNQFYWWQVNEDTWMEWKYPYPLPNEMEKNNIYKFPPDADLIYIEIHINPDQR